MNASSPNVSDAATVLRAFHRTEGWWWREEGVETAWKSLGTALLTTPSIRQHKRTNPFSAALLLRGRNRTSSGIVSERREKSRRRVHTHTRTDRRETERRPVFCFFLFFFGSVHLCYRFEFPWMRFAERDGANVHVGFEQRGAATERRQPRMLGREHLLEAVIFGMEEAFGGVVATGDL